MYKLTIPIIHQHTLQLISNDDVVYIMVYYLLVKTSQIKIQTMTFQWVGDNSVTNDTFKQNTSNKLKQDNA